jgi:hypothetical protein
VIAGQIKRREVFASRLLCQLRGQTVFVPQGRPKIARSFNCGKRYPTNQAPEGRQEKWLPEILPPLRGLWIFITSNPQLKLRAIFIRASGAGFRPDTLSIGDCQAGDAKI